jgi:branched-chain amino acid transport system substrate-binding protein
MLNNKAISTTYAAILIAILIIAGVAGFYIFSTTQDTGRKIKVGAPLAFTGRFAAVAEDSRDAINLAVEEINYAGGIMGHEIEVYYEDIENLEAGPVSSVFTKLATRDKVDFIMTHFATTGGAEYAMVEEYKIPYISCGSIMTAEAIVGADPDAHPHNFFGLPSYSLYQTVFPEYVQQLIDEGKFKPINNKFCVIKRSNEYSLYIADGQKENFLKMGWELTFEELLPKPEVEDWSAVLAKIRSDPPAIIINTMYTSSSDALFLEQFLADPTPSLIYLQATPTYPEFLEYAGRNSDGVLHCYGIKKVASTDPYIIKYNENFGRKPSPYGIIMYDQVYVMKQAMERAGDPFDREAVAKAMMETDHSGVLGRYVRAPNHLVKGGGTNIPFPIFQLWGGEVSGQMLYPDEVKETEFKLPPWYEKGLQNYG